MNKARQKFLNLIKSRVTKYRNVQKPIIERKIDKLLAHDHIILESISGITKQISVPYALIGGHAVTIHGNPRMTEDVDILTAPKYVDKIVDALGIKVENSLTVGGVAGKTLGGFEIDIIAPEDQKWVSGALTMAKDTPHGKVVSKPYLVLTKIWSSRTQDDTDIINILSNMDTSDKDATKMLVKEYFPNMIDDINQMIEIADLGINLS